MSPRIFVTGTGTDVGKTLVSAVCVHALEADYWKPVQSGSLEFRDRDQVQAWVGIHGRSVFHPESYAFKNPLSPHAAARLEGVSIELNKIRAPETSRTLIIEGAGGLLVPLNDHAVMADLIQTLEAEVILVSRHILGSINHTLLSLEAIRHRGLRMKGILFVGNANPETESAILSRHPIKCLGRIPETDRITPEFVRDQAEALRERLTRG